jgi:hypothetical protein
LHGTWDPMKGDDTRDEKARAWDEDEKARAWDGDARVVPYDILGSGLQVQDSWAWDGDEEARAWDENEEARAF